MRERDPLLDIAPASEVIAGLTVTGVSLRGVAKIMARQPILAELFGGGTVDLTRALAAAPDAVAAFVAAAIGRAGDDAAEAAIDNLALGTQAQLLDAAIRYTFPEGIAPFKDRLLRLASALTVNAVEGADGAAQASPRESNSS